MTSRDFCFWLQGYFEINNSGIGEQPALLTNRQVQVVQNHLNLVFKHEIDPSMGNTEHQEHLNTIHGSGLVTLRC